MLLVITVSSDTLDVHASSAAEIVAEIILNTRLKLNRSIAEKLFIGLVADTDRFLFSYTTDQTFNLVSKTFSI